MVGARKFLIAYNVNLGTPDVAIAKKIAKTIRFSTGGFRYVKSMGVMLASRNLAQVSINLTDFEQTPMHLVFETVRREAERYGVPVVGSEIVGLIPKKAIEMSAEYFLRFENFRPELVLENRIADALAVAQRTARISGRAGLRPPPLRAAAARRPPQRPWRRRWDRWSRGWPSWTPAPSKKTAITSPRRWTAMPRPSIT